ncbi:MAG: pantoate--beta-alanine ligase [Kiritimatiellae bacterium]|nr:pantoate--beta-alanine ligase [Kiritimatiellia bacterium]
MKIFTSAAKLQKWCREKKRNGRRIALVPTMGCLHEGHLSLIETARRKKADEIVVSIFVNPVQFGPNEDYAKYPREEKADLAKCRKARATAVFLPSPAEMYASDHSVYVNEETLSKGLCGARRPGHFRGVCTVVAKLFNIVGPDFAVFGQKDYQQAQVIKRMVRDLDFGIDIVVAPIVREKSGLAKSSRNTYLDEGEKERAVVLSRAVAGVKAGEKAAAAKRRLRKMIDDAGLETDYVEIVSPDTLEDVKSVRKGDVVLVAAKCGKTRLIDNGKI